MLLSSVEYFFLSESEIDPIFLNCFVIKPFLPNKSVLSWLTCERSSVDLNLGKNSSLIFF